MKVCGLFNRNVATLSLISVLNRMPRQGQHPLMQSRDGHLRSTSYNVLLNRSVCKYEDTEVVA